MEENIVQLVTAIAEIVDEESEYAHPLLTKIKFVFATTEGARLSTASITGRQGIKLEDFDAVIKSAINTPVKMRYLGSKGVGSHIGSIPIGHIIDMEKTKLDDGVDALVAHAVLYTSEYPQEVEYLKEAYASGKAPGISYEIRHNPDLSIIENGVEWIKGLVTQAATIVRSPAYGSRTAIMALASNGDLTDEERNIELLSLITPKESIKGGSDMEEKDKEIKELKDQLIALATEKDSATTTYDSKVAELQAKIDELTTSNTALSDELNGIKRVKLVEDRARAYAEAGLAFDTDDEKANAKKELLAEMPENIFVEYITDLKALKGTALASASGPRVPRLAVASGEGKMTLDELKSKMRARE